MSGTKGLIDSNIIIYLSNGLMEISDLFEKYDELLISRITHMEVLGFDFKEESDEELVNILISNFQILEIDEQVGVSTIQVRKKKKIKLPDAIIYATAMENNCELVTADVKDFNGLDGGVRIYNPLST